MRAVHLSVLLATLLLRAPSTAEVRKANGSVELPDVPGDCSPIHSSERDYPGLDVVKLALLSDGQHLTVTATLKDPPGVFASEVVNLYIDADNNAQTGAELTFPPSSGWEYKGELDACANYADKSSACIGGSPAKVTNHYAVLALERYKGKGAYDRETVVDSMGFPGTKPAPQMPIAGNIVSASLDYADLKAKSGQLLRIRVEEACGSSAEDHGFFPEILLTLE